MSEQWRPVVGYEGLYEVSDLGRVRSVMRRGTSGAVLTPWLAGGRYMAVQLWHGRRRAQVNVHRLVGEAFLGPLPRGLQTLHGPSGKLDNSLSNLRYGTQAENEADKRRDGTASIGAQHPCAKLTESLVAECRAKRAWGATLTSLASEFGVARSTMSRAVSGIHWRHVPIEDGAS